MVNNISFFTPVIHMPAIRTQEEISNGIEKYFYLGGKCASILRGRISGEGQAVSITEGQIDESKAVQVIQTIVKIISYMTVIIPLIMLIAKAAFRSGHSFYVFERAQRNNYKPQDNHKPQDNPRPPEPAAQLPTSAANVSAVTLQTQPLAPVMPAAQAASAAQAAVKSQAGVAAQAYSVAGLMQRFTKAWDNTQGVFKLPSGSFHLKSFSERLSKYAAQFAKKNVDHTKHFGHIEKFDLDPAKKPKIYVRADLHGDLKSLLENIRSLQKEGLLDENFKCKPGVHLVFLGDYCDRGDYGTEILDMLMSLREENPQQIHLIRGNHEEIVINRMLGDSDKNLKAVLDDENAAKALQSFYETMSLTTYFSAGKTQDGRREYVQCTHGLFEPTMDPSLLIDSAYSHAYLPVPRERILSERIRLIAAGNTPLAEAAKRIAVVVESSVKHFNQDYTAYNWADVTDFETMFGPAETRRYALCAQDIRYYLDLSSEQHRVMKIFRGHQHKFQHLTHEGEVLVTTLPVGMNGPYKTQWLLQPDRAYIIEPAILVKDWKKKAILRPAEYNTTTEITDPFPLTSSDI